MTPEGVTTTGDSINGLPQNGWFTMDNPLDDLGVPSYQETFISIHFAVLVTATSNAFQRSNVAAPLARAEGCCTFGSTSPILTGQTRMAWIWEFDQWRFQEPNPQVLTRYKAYFSGLSQGIFTKHVALYCTVPPF